MLKKWLVSIVLAIFATAVVAADRIDRIEPESWWVGMKDDRLQLMVHGDRVAELEPRLQYAGVSIEGVERVANPNYLFINVRVGANTKPGQVRIDFLHGKTKVASRAYPLGARAAGSADRVGFGPADAIYLITPDRFANGDSKNDRVKGMAEAVNRANDLGRHGGDLQGIANHLDYIAGMGFTQLWLNPVLENNQPDTSYHGYAITDFYRVDARFGSNDSYRQLAADARKRGVGLIMDVVLNHCGSGHWWMRDPPTSDWFNNGGKFIATSHEHETVQDPHAAAADLRAFADGWFVPTMPDLNQRNPYLATYLIQNSLWWIEYAGLSGLRVDTYPYADRAFLSAWSRRVMQEYPRLNVVAEEWRSNPITVSYWQRGRTHADGYVSELPSLFDFPLQETAAIALKEKESSSTGLVRIYRILASDGVYADPYNLVVFPDNHDMSRILTQLGERTDLQRMASVFFLTTRGIPQFYYGTEILMSNQGTEAHGIIRSDFPGGWQGDASNAFTGHGLNSAARETQEFTRKLLNWRRTAPAMRDGRLTQYVPKDGVYVYFRHNDAQTVMVVLNNADESRLLDMHRFEESTGGARTATDVITQQERTLKALELPARSATVFELK